MNLDQPIPASQNKQPLLVTLPLLKKSFAPFCKGKKPLLDMIVDIWNAGIPQPQTHNGQLVKMIYPQHLEQFTRQVAKENG